MFAYECAPWNSDRATIAAQRPAGLARHLAAAGWRAIVITCDGARRRIASAGDLPRVAEDARAVLRGAPPDRAVVVPTPSLTHDGLLDAAWWRLASAPTGSPSARLRAALTAAKWFGGDLSRSWQPCAWAAAVAVAEATPIHACLAEHSPDAALFLASRFSRTHGVPWGADFRDPVLRPLGPLGRRLYAPVVRRLLRTAAFTVSVSPHWRELDAALLRRRAVYIPNGFDPEEFDGPDPPRDPDRLVVAYMGNLVREQNADAFFDGIALLRRERGESVFRRLRFIYRGGQAEAVTRRAAEAGVAEVVDAGPAIPRGDALRALRSADLLLLLSMPPASRADPCLARGLYPGKTFEYFGARRPILCVPGDGDLLDALVGESRTGVVRGDGAGVAAVLADGLDRKAHGEHLPYFPDEAVVASFARPVQARALAALLDESVARAETSAARPPVPPAPPGGRRILMLVNNSVRFDQRVRRHASALAGAGHAVSVVGVTAPAEDPVDIEPIPGVDLRWVRRDSGAGAVGAWNRLASAITMRLARGAWATGLRSAGIADRVVAPTLGLLRNAAGGIEADLLYAHDLNTLPAAAAVAAERGVPLVYDAHEWYAGEGASPSPATVAAVRSAEGRGVAAAALVLTVAPGVAGRLREAYGVAPVVVRNMPPFDAGISAPRVPPRPLPLRVLYHSAHLALDGRRLRDLISAAARLDGRIHLRLRGGATPMRERELLDNLRATLRPGTWSFQPALPYAEMIREAARSDVGVVLNSGAVENEALTLPNKVFEYMMVGLAVVAYRTEAVAAVVEATDAGLVTGENTVEALTEALARLEADRELVAAMQGRGRAAAERAYRWREESKVLLRALESVSAPPGAP